MAGRKTRILFIDDDNNFRKVQAYALRQEGYDVVAASNGEEGIQQLEEHPPDLALCDLKMPVMDGMEFLRTLSERSDSIPVIVITAFGTIETAVEAMRAGAVDYITKPVNREELRLAIQRALEYEKLKEENRRLRERVAGGRAVDRLLGKSPKMQSLRDTLLRLAESDAPVLLRGESGVGKELAARALHFDGPRANTGRFVVLNCAAIPGELLESELFGHRKGSFTGAHQDHTGKFEAADGGTLFLDEIGDMPLALQAKLLRALQQGEITPIGENEPRRINVRVVAATNQPLEQKIKDGSFREDLFYRLAVVPVDLPPLREKPEDLPILFRFFLSRYGAAGAELSEAALKKLQAHTWPGNVRELENIVMRACALNPELQTLDVPDLPPTLSSGEDSRIDHFITSEEPVQIPNEGIQFEELERRLLEAAWEQSGHTQTKGAQLLGLPRQAFIYRLQKHGIIPSYRDKEQQQ